MAKKNTSPVYQEPSVTSRIGDAVALLDGLQWAVDRASSEDDYWRVMALLRSSLPTVGAVLEAANVALGAVPIGRYA